MKLLKQKSLYQIAILNKISDIKNKIRKKGGTFKDYLDIAYLECMHEIRGIYNEYLDLELTNIIKSIFKEN